MTCRPRLSRCVPFMIIYFTYESGRIPGVYSLCLWSMFNVPHCLWRSTYAPSLCGRLYRRTLDESPRFEMCSRIMVFLCRTSFVS